MKIDNRKMGYKQLKANEQKVRCRSVSWASLTLKKLTCRLVHSGILTRALYWCRSFVTWGNMSRNYIACIFKFQRLFLDHFAPVKTSYVVDRLLHIQYLMSVSCAYKSLINLKDRNFICMIHSEVYLDTMLRGYKV